jgi:hypothetical protein
LNIFIFRVAGFGVKNFGQCGGKDRGMFDERLKQNLFSYEIFKNPEEFAYVRVAPGI